MLSSSSNWARGGVKGPESGSDGEAVLAQILGGDLSVVASCGSGMTACVIWLALQELSGGAQAIALYDEVGAALSRTARIPQPSALYVTITSPIAQHEPAGALVSLWETPRMWRYG